MGQGKGGAGMAPKQQNTMPAEPAKGKGCEKVSAHVRSQAQHHANTARKGGGK